MDEPPVLARVHGAVGHLTLNRPRAINALDRSMIELLTDALRRWRDDRRVRAVVLDGAGERGFCAGADVRALRDAVLAGDAERAAEFLRAEYRLNAAIAEYPVPVVAVMDGITMGGGVGLSAHAAVRVVTERSVVAMPETRIGFVPDVGSTYLLSRSPGRLGVHLAATASTVGPGDAVHVGLTDLHVPAARLGDLVAALVDGADPAAAVTARATDPSPATLPAQRTWIDACYATTDPVELLERLAAHPDAAAARTAAEVRALAPTAVAVTLAVLERAGTLDLRGALDQEYRVGVALAARPDFAEGVRAQLVDKDRRPRWTPARVEDLPGGLVDELLDADPVPRLWG